MSVDSSKINWRELGYIVSRNVFLIVNGVIVAIAALLAAFGDVRAGVFLASILAINIALGLFQDIRAWLTLRKLRFLTAPHVVRIGELGAEESVLVEMLRKGDRIKVKIGDQIPCDGRVEESRNLDVNEGLITGESNSIAKAVGDAVSAGGVVTSGTATIVVSALFQESRIARMTEGVKRYSSNMSPIQKGVEVIVRYEGYLLVALLAYIVIHGLVHAEPAIRIIKSAGALTNLVVSQGLVFASTLLFAYGAAHFFRRNVLLQEVNATEKLGRIRNLCMDKTGTLTENSVAVSGMFMPQGVVEADARNLAAAYVQGSGDASQSIRMIEAYVGKSYEGKVVDAVSFSSWRRYGAIVFEEGGAKSVIVAGSPDIFLSRIKDDEKRKWLSDLVVENNSKARHMLCFARGMGDAVPQSLDGFDFSVFAVFVFENLLREGVRDTVDFFQKRGVKIRIISGDNLETAAAVSRLAGIEGWEKTITGQELESWTPADYDQKVADYRVFAKIVPEQKEKIVAAFKKDGFTAMIGDGANDALAIKNADLGIAMFDGAPATRELASVVLTNNSFAALPGGVELADSIIRNLEVFAAIFFNQSVMSVFLFAILAAFGYSLPLSPLNITLVNYFTVGIPGILISYWSIRPQGKVKPAGPESFLKKVFSFVIGSAAIQAVAVAALFFLSPASMRAASTNMPVIVGLIVTGFVFFLFAPRVYLESVTPLQRKQLLGFGIFEAIILPLSFALPLAATFFDVSFVSLSTLRLFAMGSVLLMAIVAQYLFAKSRHNAQMHHS